MKMCAKFWMGILRASRFRFSIFFSTILQGVLSQLGFGRGFEAILLLIELSRTHICKSKVNLEVKVLVFRYLLSPPELHFVFPSFFSTSMDPGRESTTARA